MVAVSQLTPPSDRLIDLDQVAGRVAEERLPTDTADLARFGHGDVVRLEVATYVVDVVDLQCEVLALVRLEPLDFEEMDLLLADLQPRSVEREVRSIVSLGHPEHVGVERDRFGRIGDVERHVMDARELHDLDSIDGCSPAETRRCDTGAMRSLPVRLIGAAVLLAGCGSSGSGAERPAVDCGQTSGVTVDHDIEALDSRADSALVHLPPCYDVGTASYPTVFLLHGAGMIADSWVDHPIRAGEVIDQLVPRSDSS